MDEAATARPVDQATTARSVDQAQLSSSITASVATKTDMTKRRKSSGSIWKMIRDDPEPEQQSITATVLDKNGTVTTQYHSSSAELLDSSSHIICGTCGSHNVIVLGSTSNRNQDLTKGETWGMKDRENEIFTRFQCQSCGRIWNEEG